MKTTAQGFLAVWMDVEPSGEEDFNAWYTKEHVPERVGVPGFLLGKRYLALNGSPRYFSVYDTESAGTLSSPPYLERLNDPSPWTQRVMPNFRNTIRSVCHVLGVQGVGMGGILRAYRIEPREGQQEALAKALAGEVLAALAEKPGVARVCVGEREIAKSSGGTAEVTMRGEDATATFVLLVEGDEAGPVEAACREVLAEARLQKLNAKPPVRGGTYRLIYALAD